MSDRSLAVAARRPLPATLLLALVLSLVLALSARVEVPFWPVPMTLQTLSVLAIGGLFGPRTALAAMAVYLAEGAAGLPVFAGTPERGLGLAYLAGPTGGYLAGMAAAAGIAGWAGRLADRPALLLAAMLAAMAVVYACGAAWLAHLLDWRRAWTLGVVPFVAGDLVKVALASALVLAVRRRAA